jgi:Na+-transporting NADH:ubiquinone oxidoreductase subunit NqrE
MNYKYKLNKYLQKGGAGIAVIPVDPLQQVKESLELNDKIKNYVKLLLVLEELRSNLAQNMRIYVALIEVSGSLLGDFLFIINRSLQESGLLTVENTQAMIAWTHSEIDRLKSITTL